MISSHKSIAYFLDNVPEFRNEWRLHLASVNKIPTLCQAFSEFSDLTIKNILNYRNDCKERIFDSIEFLLEMGDEEVKDAVTTCFLENLLNAMSGGSMKAKDFVRYLKPLSIEYCRAWDAFTGIKTEGLYD